MFEKIRKLLSADLGLPADVLLGEMLVSFVGESRVLVSNYRNILFFDGHTLKIQGRKQKLLLSGRELSISRYDQDELEVGGSIQEMKFYH